MIDEVRDDVGAEVFARQVWGQAVGEPARAAPDIDHILGGLQAVADEDLALENAKRDKLAADRQLHRSLCRVTAAERSHELPVRIPQLQF